MKHFFKTLCILLAMAGMLSSCSGHRAFEECANEFEETSQLEDLVTRREESSRASGKRERSLRHRWFLKTDSHASHYSRVFMDQSRLSQSSEREYLNGSGTFLLL